MFKRIRLENFKSWRELDIELAPVTILFGTNSSGKSSVLQALLLIAQSLRNHHWITEVDFGGKDTDYVNLGSFRDIVYNHDLEREVHIILDTYEAVIWHSRDDDIVHGNENGSTELLYEMIQNNNKFHYLGPLRQYAQRSYLWSGVAPQRIEKQGENTMAILIESQRKDRKLIEKVKKWLVEIGLVKNFYIKPLDTSDRFYEPLADINGIETSLSDVGFGISQLLPVITMLLSVPKESLVLLEQPELHLHPRAQAHLADLMLHVAEERKLQLIVESHSEHLLRRLQRRIAEVENEFASPENVKMYFCDTGENGSTIQEVKVDEYGQIQNWPDKFFGDITGDLEAMTMAALQRSMNGKD